MLTDSLTGDRLTLVDERALEYRQRELYGDEFLPSNGHLVFSETELDRMSHTMLRRLAQHADSDEVSGRSTRIELKKFFHGQHELSDFS